MTQPTLMNGTTHWTLQGKGGVGKSLVSSILGQYFTERGYIPACADTDPVNSTFHRIESLNVTLVPITDGGTVVQRLFDPLFEAILSADGVSVIDNGASTFLPITQFIGSNSILEAMAECDKRVFIHSIITGGQAKDDTVTGLIKLIELVKNSKTNAKIVVWQNDFWGMPSWAGESLEKMEWIKNNSDIIQGIVQIVDRKSDAFSTDIRLMSEFHLTCREFRDSDQFGMLAKSRVFRVFNDVYSELDRVFGVVQEA
ncbi:hypothetical protein D3C84_688190 [compost metagenome]|jgi:hypothetical protein